MHSVLWEQLTSRQQALLDAAAAAMERAYAPYSGFSVGAALLSHDGQMISAANVENAAYGSTICAERMALGRANAEGKRLFSSIAVIARGRDFATSEVTTPCGACRQMLFEFSQLAGVNLEVIMANTKKDKIILSRISELLPMGFGPRDLGIDVADHRK